MRYEAPESLEGAVALLAGATGETRVLAGGTDLLVQMRADVVDPELIVDIKKIPETRAVTEEKGGWRIGAAVTGAELKEHARLKKAWPGVVEAANLIGSTQVQGRATLGGNLCNGSPAADSVPALIAAGAVATLAGPKGKRDLPVEDVMLGPRKLALTRGEIVVSFLLPPRPPRSSDAYLRFIPRTEMDIAVVGAGVSLTLDGGGTITAARVSLGAVAARVLLVSEAAQAIIGSRLDRAAQDRLEFAFTHTHAYGETYWSFVNGQHTHDGGTHQSAFREGLLKAVKKFDPDQGVKFISYAVWWVRQAIFHALSEHARVFRLPQKLSGQVSKVETARARLARELERPPTTEELAQKTDLTTEQVESLLLAAGDDVSLSAAVGEDGNMELGDTLEQDTIPSVELEMIRSSFEQRIQAMVGDLEEKEREVIRMRFGLDGEEPRTLQEIGEALGLSRERIRQIESKAKEKLRRSREAQGLRGQGAI